MVSLLDQTTAESSLHDWDAENDEAVATDWKTLTFWPKSHRQMFNSLRNIGYCKRWVEVQNRDIKFPKCLWHRLQFDDLDMNDELGPWWINASSKKSHHASRKLQLISTQDWASLWSQGLAGVGMQASWYENYQWLPLVFAIPLVAGTAVFTALVVSWSLPLSNVWKLGNSHRSSIVEIRSRGDNKWFCNNRLPGLPSSLKSQRVFQAFQASNFPILSTLRLHHFASRQSKTEGGPLQMKSGGRLIVSTNIFWIQLGRFVCIQKAH